MSDEQENVGAGSETSGEQATDTTTATETVQTDSNVQSETTATDTGSTASQEAAAQDAGGAAEQQVTETIPLGDESRTGFVEGPVRAGDPCVCPDGRAGTVAIFADGLAICLPNQG